MATSKKTAQADRSHGGPGSSHQDASEPKTPRRDGPLPGEPTNPPKSRVSGGGGERDARHSHDPKRK